MHVVKNMNCFSYTVTEIIYTLLGLMNKQPLKYSMFTYKPWNNYKKSEHSHKKLYIKITTVFPKSK